MSPEITKPSSRRMGMSAFINDSRIYDLDYGQDSFLERYYKELNYYYKIKELIVIKNIDKDRAYKNSYLFDWTGWVKNTNQQRLLSDFGMHYISYVKARSDNGMDIGDVRVPFSILIKHNFKKIHDNFITEKITYDYI